MEREYSPGSGGTGHGEWIPTDTGKEFLAVKEGSPWHREAVAGPNQLGHLRWFEVFFPESSGGMFAQGAFFAAIFGK